VVVISYGCIICSPPNERLDFSWGGTDLTPDALALAELGDYIFAT
jgi:hypothetical protein